MMRIAYALLWVHDQDEALAFYTEKLGWEVRADATSTELGNYRWLTVGPAGQPDVAVVLNAIPDPPVMDAETAEQVRTLMAKGFAGTLLLTSDDVNASYEELTARGVEFVEPPEGRPYGIDSAFRRFHETSVAAVERSGMEGGQIGNDQMAQARSAATAAIVDSQADKKLVVAGPGTGKTHTFKQALQSVEGKGLALTFIRNLVADLEEALGDLADVFTFHGFCKRQMHLNSLEGLVGQQDYYPPFLDLVVHDLRLLGRPDVEKDDVERALHTLDDSDGLISDTLRLGDYYKAVSHTDVVYRMLRFFEANDERIPVYPLIVVDEYQDFSLLETSFIAAFAAHGRARSTRDGRQRATCCAGSPVASAARPRCKDPQSDARRRRATTARRDGSGAAATSRSSTPTRWRRSWSSSSPTSSRRPRSETRSCDD